MRGEVTYFLFVMFSACRNNDSIFFWLWWRTTSLFWIFHQQDPRIFHQISPTRSLNISPTISLNISPNFISKTSEYFTNKISEYYTSNICLWIFHQISPTQQMLWTKPPTPGNCYRHSTSHRKNNLFWKSSKSLPPNHEILFPFHKTAARKPCCSPYNHQHHQRFTGFWSCTARLLVKPMLKKPSLDHGNLLKNYRLISELQFMSKMSF